MDELLYLLAEDKSIELSTTDGVHLAKKLYYLIDTTPAQPIRYVVISALDAYELAESKGLAIYKTEQHIVSVNADIYDMDARSGRWTDYIGTCVLNGMGVYIFAQRMI